MRQVNDEASEKVLQVEQRYNKVRKPIYIKRSDVIAKVPDFWKTSFLHHPVLSDLITEDDEEALCYLSEVGDVTLAGLCGGFGPLVVWDF